MCEFGALLMIVMFCMVERRLAGTDLLHSG